MKKLVRSWGQLVAYLAFTAMFLFLLWRVADISTEFRDETRDRQERECRIANQEKDALRDFADAYTRALIGASDPPENAEERKRFEENVARFKELVSSELEPAIKHRDCTQLFTDERPG